MPCESGTAVPDNGLSRGNYSRGQFAAEAFSVPEILQIGMMTARGDAKLLDFGITKAATRASGEFDIWIMHADGPGGYN
jgi:hypothetical protein